VHSASQAPPTRMRLPPQIATHRGGCVAGNPSGYPGAPPAATTRRLARSEAVSGLAIVKTVAEASGGAATASPRPGQGLRFEMTLPLG
jgi:hypothetical protein